MSDTIRWGVLSTSRHAATTWIPACHAAQRGEVVAVASRDADRARQYASENGIPRSFGDYESLLASPDVDAVYIPLPNHLHKEWTIKAAQAGKHVLCEKPLGLDAAQAEEMVAACRAAGVTLAEAFQWRHHPHAEQTRDLLQSGAIGDLRLIEAGFSFPLSRAGDVRWDPSKGGGALYDVGCYPVALARYVTGGEPVSVTAQAIWGQTGVDDLLVATLEFPGGVFAKLHGSFVLALDRYYRLVGTEGWLLADYAYNPKDDRPNIIRQYGPDWEQRASVEIAPVNSYTLMIDDLSERLLAGQEPRFPAEDAIGNMRAIDALYLAARTGRTVRVGE